MTLYFPPSTNGLQKTLGAQLDEAAVTVTLNNTTGIQNKAGVFVVDRVDTGGTEKSAAVREYISFTGVSGSTLTGLTRGVGGGGVDQDHAIGAVVEFISDVVQQQGLIDTIVAEHSVAGVHDATKVAMLAGAQTFTGAKTFTTGLLKAVDITSGSGVNTLPTSSQTLVGRTTTDTLTNKRITKRVLSATSYTTDTGTSLNCDNYDMFIVTAQAGDLKFNNPAGTPTEGQTLILSVSSSTTAARALTWDTLYEASTVALPTTTAATTARLTMGFIWRVTPGIWTCVAVA
jgi:hypothetical protein